MENPTFCFRFWQKYLSEQENTFLDITKKCQISAVYYEQYPFTIFSKGANVLNETELCRFFILAPWKEIKERSEEYRLAMAKNDPKRFTSEKEMKKFRFGIF